MVLPSASSGPARFSNVAVLKDKMYHNDPRTDNDLKEGIQNDVISVSRAEIRHATKNVFFILGVCLSVHRCICV